MRIGILTFTRSINYGAYLQCYSLYCKLKQIPGIEVIVINYNTLNTELYYVIKALLGNPFKGIKRYNVFRNSINSELKLSDKCITNNYEKATNYLNSLNCDIIVTGSDEVWKIDLARKYPNIYWKSSGVDARKISYAASANKTDVVNMSKELIEDIKKELENYSYLGVRDNFTYQFLKNILFDQDVFINCDPTFLYDFQETPGLEKKIINKHHIDLGRPIIGLVTESRVITELIRDHYGADYQLVAIAGRNKHADKWLYDLTPFEWANVYKCFSGCVTEYFHGTIFSILNKIPFVSFDRKNYALKQATKIEDFLNKAGLMDNYCNILRENINIIALKLKENMKTNNKNFEGYEEVVEKERIKYAEFELVFRRLLKNQQKNVL